MYNPLVIYVLFDTDLCSFEKLLGNELAIACSYIKSSA